MNRQWLVTGANGYLGGELCDGMRRAGHTVCGFVRSGRSSEIRQAKGVRCETYEALPEIMSAGDVLVHCAGKVCATGNWADYERTNVDWSVSLYDSAASRGAACFIYVSSIAAVGYSNRNGESSLTEDAEPRLLPAA